MLTRHLPTLLALIACASPVLAQPAKTPAIVPPDAAWAEKIATLAPKTPRVTPSTPRKLLVCSLATGYCHDVIPHVKVVLDTLAKTGAFEVVHSNDIAMFEADRLAQFDAVLLNSTCTRNPGRNWFMDVLAGNASLTPEQRQRKAAELEQTLLDYVAAGKGIIAVHGAIVFLNQSQPFSRMMGGSFVQHPKLQSITLMPVEPSHPLLKAFGGRPFVHLDEPYLFNNAYADKDFRPLLEMDVSALDPAAQAVMQGDHRYVSWIRKHGNGRVFYVSPSHHPSTYERAEMLQFYLDGIQYALGDLPCADSPVK